MRRIFAAVHTAFHQTDTHIYRLVNGFVWLLIFLSVGLLLIEVAFGLDFHESPALRVVDDVILVLFAIEITLRIVTYRDKKLDFYDLSKFRRVRVHIRSRLTYAAEPMNLIDMFTVLALVPELRALRALRLLRLLRTAPLFRHSKAFARIARGFFENRLPFYFAFGLLGIEVLLGGFSMYLAEAADPDSQIESLADGFWWALVTLTTVGYGDISPVSPIGRAVGSVMMVGGMFTLALFAGIIGHTFIGVLMTLREDQYRMASYINHVVICGFNPGVKPLLAALLTESSPDTDIVIMAGGERPDIVPPDIAWVRGDATKEGELEKVNIEQASCALIVAPHAVTPQHADAMTIMAAFTIRSYVARTTSSDPRHRPLYIIGEILDHENTDHAYTAGVDEVIVSTRVAYTMMAHSVSVHGSAAIMAAVARAGSLNLYVGAIPRSATGPATFSAALQELKLSHDVVLLGLRQPDGRDLLNPAGDFPVAEDDLAIYLANDPVLPPAA